jgi:hypothetical protein
MNGTDVHRVGFWSAVVVAVCFTVFGVSLVVGFWADTAMLSYTASLVPAPAFVAMMASIHLQAPNEKRVWSLVGLAFAVIYAVMVTITYYVQLNVVRANPLGLSPDVIDALSFTPGSMLFAVDMLGYTFMTLATLVAAPVFFGSRLALWIRRWFILHGLLVVPTVLSAPVMFQGPPDPTADNVGALVLIGWCLIFVPLSVLVAIYFRRSMNQRGMKPEAAQFGQVQA